MNVLLTGSSGFIGKRIINVLVEKDFKIYATYKNSLDIDTSNLIKIQLDITSSNFEDYLPKNIDIVLHLAQSNQYRNIPSGIEDMYAINTHATFRLLEWARKNNIKKFIFTSTGNVYGNQNKLLKETDSCYPNSFYAASKFAAEKYVEQYSPFFEVVILRLFGVYGQGQMNMTIPNLIQRLKDRQSFSLAQNIGLEFTPIYIDDCVEYITKFILQNDLKETIYNIAGSEVVSIRSVVELMSKYLKIEPKFEMTNATPTFLKGDFSLAAKTVGFVPNISIEEGLLKILYLIK